MSGRLKAIWPPILIAVVFLAAWQLLVVAKDIQPYLLPAPSLIATNFFGINFGTSRMLGAFRSDSSTRREFMAIVARSNTGALPNT